VALSAIRPGTRPKFGKKRKPPKLAFRCLLFPELVPGGKVELDHRDAAGLYRMLEVKHDHRYAYDTNWYTEVGGTSAMTDPAERQGTPSLGEFVERRIDKRLARLRVSMPAEVLSFDKDGPSVSAQPLIDQADVDEAGARRTRRLPVLTDVPVVYFGGAGNRDTFPLERGDLVLLVFASSSIVRWKITGKGGDPGDDRHHHLSDALAIPLTRGSVDATARVLEGDDIRLGGAAATEAITRTTDVQAALVGALSDPTVAAAIVGVTAPGGAAALVVAVNAYFGTHPVTGSPKVKAE
jgi:hypothetical protein